MIIQCMVEADIRIYRKLSLIYKNIYDCYFTVFGNYSYTTSGQINTLSIKAYCLISTRTNTHSLYTWYIRY